MLGWQYDQPRRETHMTTASDHASAILALIDQDMSAGIVPRDVASFCDLHNHLDANAYALAAGIDELSGEYVNAVETEVNRRIVAGELRQLAAWRAAVAGECSHGGHGWDGETCSDIPGSVLTDGERDHLARCSVFPCETCMEYTRRTGGQR